MNKLTIQQIAQINLHWIALRFTGDRDAFRSMIELLCRQRDYNAYYSETALDGSGGWIVRIAWLQQHTRRFHNLDRALTLAQTSIAQKELPKR